MQGILKVRTVGSTLPNSRDTQCGVKPFGGYRKNTQAMPHRAAVNNHVATAATRKRRRSVERVSALLFSDLGKRLLERTGIQIRHRLLNGVE